MQFSRALAVAFLASTALAQAPAEYKKALQQQPPPAPVKVPDSKPGLTGQVSEEEFKKMHELKKDAPPKLDGTSIDIGGTKAYLSLPKNAKAPMPAVIVIHEWWGLNDNVMHWADRLAAEGYAAVAVDLYSGSVAKTPEEAMAAMRKVDEAAAVKTMLAALEFAKKDPRIQATKTACIGWCFGGGMSLKLGLSAPDLSAVVMYYGHTVDDPMELEKLRAPLLGIFGTKDKSIPPEVVKKFDEALTAAKKEHTIKSYDAEHAFANPSNARYDEKNAAAAWAEASAFLAAQLKGAKKEASEAKSPK
jgi:carboxymethylenebutenolidase